MADVLSNNGQTSNGKDDRLGDEERDRLSDEGGRYGDEAVAINVPDGGNGLEEPEEEVTGAGGPRLATSTGLAPVGLPEPPKPSSRRRATIPTTPVPPFGDPPSLTVESGFPGNIQPPIIVSSDDTDDGAALEHRTSTPPYPIYPLALEIPRISEPEEESMDIHERRGRGHGYSNGSKTPDVESGNGYGNGSGLSSHYRLSDASTPHSPVRFKDPLTEDTPVVAEPVEVSTPGTAGPDPGTQDELPFPGFVPIVFRRISQTNRLRYACLKTITWPYPLQTSRLKGSLFQPATIHRSPLD